MNKKEFYTMKEFADIFRVSLPTIKRWIKKGKIRAVKVEKTVRIPAEEIERLKKISSGTQGK